MTAARPLPMEGRDGRPTGETAPVSSCHLLGTRRNQRAPAKEVFSHLSLCGAEPLEAKPSRTKVGGADRATPGFIPSISTRLCSLAGYLI